MNNKIAVQLTWSVFFTFLAVVGLGIGVLKVNSNFTKHTHPQYLKIPKGFALKVLEEDFDGLRLKRGAKIDPIKYVTVVKLVPNKDPKTLDKG